MTTTQAASKDLRPKRTRGKERRRAQASSFLGSLVEAYDFLLYTSAAALVFPRVFFEGLDPALGATLAFITLLSGYLARPLGGLLFGHFGDRIGRKYMLFLTVLIMGIVSLLIGLMPTNLGPALSAIVLTIIRVIQGLVVGGEWGGATLLSMEHSEKQKKGLGASIAVAGGPAGGVLATLVLGLFIALPEEQFFSWGWRVPFLLSVIVVAIAIYLRLSVSESPEFKAEQNKARVQEAPLKRLLRDQRATILAGILVVLAPLFLQTMLAAYMVPYVSGKAAALDTDPVLTADRVLFLSTLASALCVIAVPMVGIVSDRLGRHRSLILAATAGIIGIWPMMALFESNNLLLVGLGFILGLPILQVSMLGVLGAYLAEQFDTTARYTGLSLTFQVGAAIGGGTAPLIAQFLGDTLGGGLQLIAAYYCLLAGLAIAAVVFTSRRAARQKQTIDVKHAAQPDSLAASDAVKP